jgi:hypothetical protein
MHVQGNQIVSVCLEQKQHCRGIEQQRQLAHEVRTEPTQTETVTGRGRLWTAGVMSPRTALAGGQASTLVIAAQARHNKVFTQ